MQVACCCSRSRSRSRSVFASWGRSSLGSRLGVQTTVNTVRNSPTALRNIFSGMPATPPLAFNFFCCLTLLYLSQHSIASHPLGPPCSRSMKQHAVTLAAAACHLAWLQTVRPYTGPSFPTQTGTKALSQDRSSSEPHLPENTRLYSYNPTGLLPEVLH